MIYTITQTYINCKCCKQKSLLMYNPIYKTYRSSFDRINISGFLQWSDGKKYLYDSKADDYYSIDDIDSKIGKCKNCQNVIWINEYELIKIEVISDEYFYRFPPKLVKDSPYARNFFIREDLTFSDYIRYLRKNLKTLSSDKELLIRKKILFLLNDLKRGIKKYNLSKFEIINLKKLYRLIPLDSDDNLFLKIEIQRALGNYEEAEKLLSKANSNKHKYKIINIRYAIKYKNPCLIQIYNNCCCPIRTGRKIEELEYWCKILN